MGFANKKVTSFEDMVEEDVVTTPAPVEGEVTDVPQTPEAE